MPYSRPHAVSVPCYGCTVETICQLLAHVGAHSTGFGDGLSRQVRSNGGGGGGVGGVVKGGPGFTCLLAIFQPRPMTMIFRGSENKSMYLFLILRGRYF